MWSSFFNGMLAEDEKVKWKTNLEYLYWMCLKLVRKTPEWDQVITLWYFCYEFWTSSAQYQLIYIKYSLYLPIMKATTAQKMNFSIEDFFSKCDQIGSWFAYIYWRNA